MDKFYKFYFAPKDGRVFPQALELAELAYKHEILKDGNETCHVVTFNEHQIELMALFYNVAGNLRPKGNHVMTGLFSRLKAKSILEKEGYLGKHENNPKKPREFIPKYIEIRKLISKRNFIEAVKKYYASLGSEFYGPLHKELIYLKKIGEIHLKGRDLLAFKTISDQSNLIQSNIGEYCNYLDETTKKWMENGLDMPLDILIKNTPTIEELDKRITVANLKVNGIDKIDTTLLDWYYGSFNLKGRMFNRYLDLVKLCSIEKGERKYNLTRNAGLWTNFSPVYYQKEVLEKGYYLNYIEAYKYGAWRRGKREPDFATLSSLEKVKSYTDQADGIQYTGRKHKIQHKEFFEINILNSTRVKEVTGNPFLELVEEILREGENMLREAHGLPKIGEGWVSEMELFNLVQCFFSDAQHHASPEWLKPQHLDVYVHSKKLAFEYQGQQHYEPIDFFGGLKSFEETVKRDKRKRLMCKKNDVLLVYWKYDEAINKEVFQSKLKNSRMLK
jgi:hypothetical protein